MNGLAVPQFLVYVFSSQSLYRVVFLYGLPTKCYVAYAVIRRKIVFICSASYAVYTVITRKIGFM